MVTCVYIYYYLFNHQNTGLDIIAIHVYILVQPISLISTISLSTTDREIWLGHFFPSYWRTNVNIKHKSMGHLFHPQTIRFILKRKRKRKRVCL